MNFNDFKHKFVLQKKTKQDQQKTSLVLEYTNPFNGKRKQQKAISFIKLSDDELIDGVVTSSDFNNVQLFSDVKQNIITYISSLKSNLDFTANGLNEAIENADVVKKKQKNQSVYILDIAKKQFDDKISENPNWAKSTHKNYRYAISAFNEYQLTKNIKYSIDDINYTFINDYERYLQKEKEYCSLVCTQRVFYLRSLIKPYLMKKADTFKLLCLDVKTVIRPDAKILKAYLNRQEIQDIFETNFSFYKPQNKEEKELLRILKLNDVRDWLMIGANIGQRIETLQILKDEQIQEDRLINVYQPKRKKTIPYIPFNNILKYYFSENKKFPKFPTQEMDFNNALRLICKIMGYDEIMTGKKTVWLENGDHRKVVGQYPRYELISSHTLRRSYCTNANLNNDNVAGAMAIVGHSKLQTFQVYNQMSEKDKIDLYVKEMAKKDDYVPPTHPTRQKLDPKIIAMKAS